MLRCCTTLLRARLGHVGQGLLDPAVEVVESLDQLVVTRVETVQ